MRLAEECRHVADRFRAITIVIIGDVEVAAEAFTPGTEVRHISSIAGISGLERDSIELTITRDLSHLESIHGRVFVAQADRAMQSVPNGFLFEESYEHGVVLCRTESPRFAQSAGTLVHSAKGTSLRFDRPLLIVHVSAAAAAVLAALPGTALEIARALDQSLASVSKVLSTFESRGFLKRDAPRAMSHAPRVTVVVPAYARPESTRATVKSALELDYPEGRLDVIVVDDASPDPFSFDHPRVRVLRLPKNGGPAAARNAGISAANGDFIAFLDNDCVASRAWLTILVGALEDAEVDIAGGRVIAANSSGIVASYESARSPLDMGSARSDVGLGKLVPYLPTTNLLVRKRTALALTGFRAGMHLGEDVDFSWRARDHGSRIIYEPSATIVHHHRDRLFAMLRRRAEYASSEARLVQLHPSSRRIFVIPITASLVLAGLVVARYSFVPIAVAVVLIIVEVFAKRRTMKSLGISQSGVIYAVLRAHGASIYHLSAAVSRYLGLALMAVAILIPRASLLVAALLFTHPIVDARIRRARLFLPLYVAIYTLEMSAYQVGIFIGRLKHRSLLFPKLQLRR